MTARAETGQFQKEAYIKSLNDSRSRLMKTKEAMLDWLYNLDHHCASEIIKIEPFLNLFPFSKGKVKDHLEFAIQKSSVRYFCLGILLRSDGEKTDLAKLDHAELVKVVSRYCTVREAKKHCEALESFFSFNRRIAALSFLGVKAESKAKGWANLPKWIEDIHAYGVACQPVLAAELIRFNQLSEQLDHAIFNFNGEAGRPRYRALRCSYTIDDADPLGPSNPAIKVITFISASTGYRRYNSLVDFKKALKRKRIGQELHRQLGIEPTKEQVAEAIGALRPRKETPFLTKDVIKACYLGRSIRTIFNAESEFVEAMEPWAELRAKLQALL